MATWGALSTIVIDNEVDRHFPVTEGNFFGHKFRQATGMDSMAQFTGPPPGLSVDMHIVEVSFTIPEVCII